jgi:hypothetical protein
MSPSKNTACTGNSKLEDSFVIALLPTGTKTFRRRELLILVLALVVDLVVQIVKC